MIKYLDDSYQDEIRALYEMAFPEDSPEFVNYYFDHYYDPDHVIGCFEKETLVSMVHLNPYQLMWQGKLYHVAYIVAVATKEDYKRQGHMRKLLNWMLQSQYEAGEVLSVLMPIDSRYYDQFGYAFIQDMVSYRFDATTLPLEVENVPVQHIKLGDGIQLLKDYNHYKLSFDLVENRGMKAFESLIGEVEAEGGEVVLVPDGYLVYYNKDEVFVRECVYRSMEGLHNCLRHIKIIAKGKVVEWMTTEDSPLRHLVPHLKGNMRTLKPFMMIRILHVQRLLEDMAGLIGDMVIQVSDKQIMANNGTYHISGQEVAVVEGSPDLTIDVESLAQWLFGYESLENLADLRETVTLNKDIIMYPEVPIRTYFNQYV